LGIVLYAMLQGSVPFKAKSMEELQEIILLGKYAFPHRISDEAKDLISKLICLTPEKRLSIPEILAHKWLKEDSWSEDENEIKYNIFRDPNAKKNEKTNLEEINIENLFFPNKPQVQLLYKDYCYIAKEFYTEHIG